MRFKVVIPARYASVRLPGKPLLELAGKPMIQHVFDRAVESGASEVVIATDNQQIVDACRGFSADVCMTSEAHRSGSDRIAEVVSSRGWADDEIIVNLQGDEPCMPPQLLLQVARDMDSHKPAAVTTLSTAITVRSMLFDPHVVKVVTDEAGYALYFSRAPVPWHRDEFLNGDTPLPADTAFARHIGLYAYRSGYLSRFVTLQRAPIERAESLEQLRVLWHGDKIHVSEATIVPGHGVDTLDDLKRVTDLLA
ncbi:MAG: 3-deoxy-manno-octulosonate cytidylyltransferase [Candidatus Thiodiazotropha sp. (ex Ctena orbiculata)]|nr:3-deoxy-manno-octulosonate cytidylyltransferase [Candidatus Thiodiazotropha taylori]MBT2998150.1 3-deoxy-manno-octulosonate cytidylyltransferase [Candidatus Thiodiazotropha taylori]MBT3002449.1 3-deoxy-manno-octulosonate cytidylyltransferase [Candidatus Thiodiazotropha taylori]MBT3026687.1 3-deoxy-manno-octulosonate cytidylyltransferase [Candidatus Thiodiazotropha taylori]MBT3034191.1 3-deoxy-manno-octulosonate cytidylyltransferase [Candidatus Thiodiazotropha taylori]